MEKIELKHLAPYLPYGLKLFIEHEVRIDATSVFDSDDIIETGVITMSGVNYENSFFPSCVLYLRPGESDGYLEVSNIKPILRPLSDLTKEIEHNGEKIVLFDYIVELCAEYASRFPNRKIRDNSANAWSIVDYFKSKILSFSYSSVQILLEYHFDVYSLIPAGLAIDINQLSPKQ